MSDVNDRKEETKEATQPNMIVQWRVVAVSGVVLSGCLLAALAVLVSVKNVDTLSTIALVLAVVGFSSQLIIAFAQGNMASQQMIQSERLNSETGALLASVGATVDSLLSTSREQFDRVLNAALNRASDAIATSEVEGKLTADSLRAQISDAIRSAATHSSSPRVEGPSPARRTRSLPDDARQAIERMTSWPEAREEAEPLFRKLHELSAPAAATLVTQAQREVEDLRVGIPVGAIAAAEGQSITDELVARGLSEVITPPAQYADRIVDGKRYVVLTNLGREVARLLIPKGKAPPWYYSALQAAKPSLARA